MFSEPSPKPRIPDQKPTETELIRHKNLKLYFASILQSETNKMFEEKDENGKQTHKEEDLEFLFWIWNKLTTNLIISQNLYSILEDSNVSEAIKVRLISKLRAEEANLDNLI